MNYKALFITLKNKLKKSFDYSKRPVLFIINIIILLLIAAGLLFGVLAGISVYENKTIKEVVEEVLPDKKDESKEKWDFDYNSDSGRVSTKIDSKIEKYNDPLKIKVDYGYRWNYIEKTCRKLTSNPDDYQKCKDSINVAGKKVHKGITIKPKIKGTWTWKYNKQLFFTPEENWKPDTDYKVVIDKSVFSKYLKVSNKTHKFKTSPLKVYINEVEFAFDPEEINKKFVQAELAFNYPINPKTLKKAASFKSKKMLEKFPLDIDLEDDNLSAMISSPVKKITKQQRTVKFLVTRDLCTPDKRCIKREREQRITIPSIYNYFKVNNAGSIIVSNEKQELEQVLTLDFNQKTDIEEVNKNLEVCLLPEYHPSTAEKDRKAEKSFHKWEDADEITNSILKDSKKVDLSCISGASNIEPIHNFRINEPEGRYLYIRLKKGLASYAEYALAEDYIKLVKIPKYRKELKVAGNGSILSLSGDKKLSVFSRGIKEISCEVSQVLPQYINHLVSQTSGNFQHPYFRNYRMSKYDISKVAEEKLTLNYVDEKSPQYSGFDFTKYLNSGKGLFFFNVKDLETGKSAKRFILITDLGFLVKESRDKSKDIFVMSISTGLPAAGAKVEVIGKNGLPVFSGHTNAMGNLAIPDLGGNTKEKTPVAYIVKKANDLAFMPYNRGDRRLNYSKFNTSGIYSNSSNLNAYMFTDRGIYRPGEKVNIGMIVKSSDWKTSLEDLPLHFVIKNPLNKIVQDEVIKLSGPGLDEISFYTGESYPTGRYNANLYISKEDKNETLLHSIIFKVEEFLPDRMKISAEFNKPEPKGWVSPGKLKANISLENLYGTPATGRKVKGFVTLTPGAFSFDEYKDYKFYNSGLNAKSHSFNLKEEQTDENGETAFDINLKSFKNPMFNLNLIVEGFEADSGRSVRTSKDLKICSREYIVGYKSGSGLGYLKKNTDHSVNIIAINNDLKKIKAGNLNISLYKKEHINTLIKDSKGKYVYDSVQKRKLLSKNNFPVPSTGIDYKLDTQTPGSYELVITDNKSDKLNVISYSVAGEANLAGNIDKKAELQLKINKEKYKKGEVIEAHITSPYSGAGLITIETDKIHYFKWFKANKTDTIQKIRIPYEFEGKGYLNVSFIRSIDSDEIYINPLSYAVKEFYVDNDNRKVKIDLDIEEITKPDQPLTIGYKTSKKSKIIIFGVDEGILQAAKYKTPSPLDYFLNSRALEVNTLQILDLILPKYSILEQNFAYGGDGSVKFSAKHLNPFKRKVKTPPVFWSGVIDADTTEKTATFKLPDYFNGTLRIIALAVSDDSIGVRQEESLRKGDFIISPNVPTFVSPDDEFYISATIANNVKNSGKNAQINLSIKPSSHIFVLEKPELPLTIAENKEKTVKYKLKANDKPGSAAVEFSVSHDKFKAAAESTLSVRPVSANVTTMQSGYFRKKENVEITRELYPEFAEMNVSVSALPLSLITGLNKYLDNYPYGCTEQLVSKMLPVIIIHDYPDFNFDKDKFTEKYKKIINTLRSRQGYDGGFSLWSGRRSSHEFASVYVMHFLTEAKERNLRVPTVMFDKGINYLKTIANRRPNTLREARTKAYVIYILTRNGIITTNYLLNLIDKLDNSFKGGWEDDTTALYIASTFKLLKDDASAKHILDSFSLPLDYKYTNNPYWYSYYSSLVLYGQYLYLISEHFPEKIKDIDDRFFFTIINHVNDRSYSTLSTAYIVQGLLSYAEALQSDQQNEFSVKVTDVANQKYQADLSGNFLKQGNIKQLLKSVEFLSLSGSAGYYQVAASGYDKNLPDKAIQNGLTVTKEYKDKNGNRVSSVKLGDELEVVIKIRAIGYKKYDDIVIVDLLPGGFDLELDKVGKPGDSLKPDYVDKREDRVIVFTDISSSEKTFSYSIKAVNQGEFTAPPVYAEAMYDLKVNARDSGGKIKIEKR